MLLHIGFKHLCGGRVHGSPPTFHYVTKQSGIRFSSSSELSLTEHLVHPARASEGRFQFLQHVDTNSSLKQILSRHKNRKLTTRARWFCFCWLLLLWTHFSLSSDLLSNVLSPVLCFHQAFHCSFELWPLKTSRTWTFSSSCNVLGSGGWNGTKDLNVC